MIDLAIAQELPYQPPDPAKVPIAGIGLHGDGSSVFPHDKPPVDFDEKTGRNLRWKIPLPNFGYSAPVPVGNRVFFLCESDARIIWPVLRCYDAATGVEVWSAVLDPFDAFPQVPAEERKRLTAVVQTIWDDNRAAFQAMRPVVAGRATLEQANAELAPRGIRIRGYNAGYGTLRYVDYPKDRGDKALWTTYNIQPAPSNQGRARTGEAFGTPVADGERIYAITIHGTTASFDIATGKRVWIRSIGGGAYREANHFMTSPRLFKDLLLAHFDDTNSGVPGVLVAYDRKTGEERWRVKHLGKRGVKRPLDHKSANGRPGTSPMIASIDGVHVAILGTGEVIRLSDGHCYAQGVQNTVQQGAIIGQSMFAGASRDGASGHWRNDLAIKNVELEVTTGWFYPASKLPGGWGTHPVAYEGRLYWAGWNIDPATGLPPGMPIPDASIIDPQPRDQSFASIMHELKNKRMVPPKTVPDTRMFLFIADDHVYALNATGSEKKPEGEHGLLTVYTVDGKKVVESPLTQPPNPDHMVDQGWPENPTFAYTCAMNIGNDCLYIASDQFLYCIGEKP